jgi:hypothetical protein
MESQGQSIFQSKYNEFIEDLLGALPEYTPQINIAKGLSAEERLKRFQEEIKIPNEDNSEHIAKNPEKVLPGVLIEDSVWNSLSENTKKAVWEHLRVLSICCFMEAGFGSGEKPVWMDDAMNEMKEKLKDIDFEGVFGKFMNFFKTDSTNESANPDVSGADPSGFFKGIPKIPEKFLKGHMAKLAEELVRDIKPEDLGMSPELVEECEKSPSRAFDILLSVFTNNPGIIQQTVQKIGKRLQQKIMSGQIRPQEIAREAEELMKEFSGNSSFVDMMDGLKSAFGFEDMDIAKQAGREGSARLAMARDRLRKKLEKKKAAAGKK